MWEPWSRTNAGQEGVCSQQHRKGSWRPAVHTAAIGTSRSLSDLYLPVGESQFTGVAVSQSNKSKNIIINRSGQIMGGLVKYEGLV